MQVVNFIINQIFREPAFFLGVVVLLGMVFMKRSGKEILISTIKTVVGVRILQVGAGQLTAASNPIMSMLVQRFGLQGRLGDPWAGVGEALQRLDPALVGNIGLVMVGAWLLHLVFSRFTPLKVVYLTGHVAFTDTAVVLFGVFAITKWADWRALVMAIVLLALYWWLGPALIKKPLQKVTKGDPITLGHNMVLTGHIAMWIAKLTGDEKNDCEKLQLPGWLSVMKDSVISYSLIMAFLYTLIGILAGPEVGQKVAGAQNYILFSFIQGINIAVGVTVLLLGVRMFLAELLPAFQGFAKVVVPGATPAVDNPVFWPYAPQATLVGLIFTVVGMVVGVILQRVLGSTYVTVPSVIPIFFGGCTLGVFANAYGGLRGTIIATFLLGIVQIFGSVWLAQVIDLQTAGGGHTDFCTLWPAVFSLLKLIPFGG